jgi:hypothetical protein
MTFGVPPFFQASLTDRYYKLMYQSAKGDMSYQSIASFVRQHPACKGLTQYFNLEDSDTMSISNSRVVFYMELLSFFFSLLHHNPSKRPKTVLDILDMPFMQNFLRNTPTVSPSQYHKQ